MAVSDVELFEQIRRERRLHGTSITALAQQFGVHRRKVRLALESATPPVRKIPERKSPKLEPFKDVIDQWLRDDLAAPRKQRHTNKRVWDRLVDECGAGELGYSTVRDYLSVRRPQIAAEGGRVIKDAHITQTYRPGEQAQVDFGDIWVMLAGKMTKCALFVFRLSFSGRGWHRVFPGGSQEAFLEGHLGAFVELGVPTVHIRYDNLKAAVKKVIYQGHRSRIESLRWTEFRSHIGFDAFYCLPGKGGAHEKGGVEMQVGYFRRNYLVPVPVVDSLEELNARLARAELVELSRRIRGRENTIGQDYEIEAPFLGRMPEEPFETGTLLTPRVDRNSMVNVRRHQYSVPVRFIGRRVRVVLRAAEIVVYDRRTEIARHRRDAARDGCTLVLDHYLETLMRKPGALAGSTALEQARRGGVFTTAHERLWQAATLRYGEIEGTRLLIEVLLLHRHLADRDVIAGVTAALSVGALTGEVIAVEARKSAAAHGANPTVNFPDDSIPALNTHLLAELPALTTDTLARVAQLPADRRPLPDVTAYDQLLHHPPAAGKDPRP